MAADAHTHTVRGGRELVSAGRIVAPLTSLEFHPWRVEENFTRLPEDFVRNAPRAAALGECGLDRMRGPSLSAQLRAFTKVCELAASLNKNLVVHAVKCDTELFAALKDFPGKVLVHGFRHAPRRLETLLEKGFFVSLAPFGWRYGGLGDFLKANGFSRIGFESDDGAVPVPEIIAAAGAELGIVPPDAASERFLDSFLGN